jgi:hypothetical protein
MQAEMNFTWRVTNLIRALKIAVLSGLLVSLLGACSSGGGGDTTPLPGEELALLLFAASPSTGPSPLNATLTAVVSGGNAPYDFAWDFENDGSFDAFTNDTFDTTVSRAHQYALRAADAGGTSSYEAIVRVTDASGAQLTSDVRNVIVTAGSSSLLIDPIEIFVEDELGNRVDPATHVFTTGERVRFHYGDRSNLSYQWDFDFQKIDISLPPDQQVTPANPTFIVDTTQVSPSHVFYNTGTGLITYVVQVRLRDPLSGDTAAGIFNITVAATTPDPSDNELQADINSSPAAGNDGVITLRFDPTGLTPGVPTEPRLELSAVVSDDPALSGEPPYEFYWDFENDGKIDKAANAPSIPYYDPLRKIEVNPYLHGDDLREYELRLLAIDVKGHHSTVLRTIRSLNVGNRPPDALNFNLDYGFGNPRLPYSAVDGPADSATATYTITPQGSTGFYEYKIDVDGDGVGDFPAGDAWASAGVSGASETIAFGPHDDPLNPGTTINPRPVPGYYPVQVIVRSVDAAVGGNQVDILTRQAPVSLVQIGDVSNTVIDADPLTGEIDPLPAVQDHQMVGFAQTAPGGGNGQSLAVRGVIVTGGARGTTALRDVFRISQTLNAPLNPGEFETHASYAYDPLVAMNVARRGHGSYITSDPNTATTDPTAVIYSWGGRNSSGPLASGEFAPFSLGATNNTWVVSGSELNGSSFPLYDFGISAANFGNPFGVGAVFAGGLNQQDKNSNANVSPSVFGHDPSPPPGNLPFTEPSDDFGWLTLGGGLAVPRYDLSLVIAGGELYALGGRTSSGASTATVEFLDNGVWTQLPNMKHARAGASAEVIDPDGAAGPMAPQIYVYGGAFFPGTAGNRTLVAQAEVFNTATQTWSLTVPPTEASFAGAAARLPGPGSVKTGSELFNSIWYFGGESGATTSLGETNRLEEFIYFYNVP